MCGRLNVTDDPVVQWICDHLGIPFMAKTNTDLRPTQKVATVVYSGSLQQLNTTWGIKPSWSKKLLINAQGETVATKKTFKTAFTTNRCLVPCTGWYEWHNAGGLKKQKYSFTHADGFPFLMAGIFYDYDQGAQLVTLTTHPNNRCAQIHDRMPLLILPENIDCWFNSTAEQVRPLLEPIDSDLIEVQKCE